MVAYVVTYSSMRVLLCYMLRTGVCQEDTVCLRHRCGRQSGFALRSTRHVAEIGHTYDIRTHTQTHTHTHTHLSSLNKIILIAGKWIMCVSQCSAYNVRVGE